MTTTTNTNVPIKRFGGATLGTATVTLKVRNIEMEATAATFGLSLPAGRWLTRVRLAQVPATLGYPLIYTSDNTLASPGTVTVPALGPQWSHLDIDFPTNRRDLKVEITVDRWTGSAWKPYASSAVGGNSVVITGGTPHAPRSQLRGANVHPFGTIDSATRTLPLVAPMVDLGMDLIRTSLVPAIGWQSNQTFSAAWLAQVDILMNEVTARGLQTIVGMSMNAVPSWYTGTSGTYSYNAGGLSGSYKVAREGTTTIWSQSDISAMIAALATRYGTSIYGYEGQNEPDANSSTMLASDQVLYARRIKVGVAASSQTGVKTILGPLTQGNFTFLDDMVAGGLVDADFDLFGLHAYHVRFVGFTQHIYSSRIPMSDDYSQSIAGMERFRDYYESLGFTKNFAVTEFGVSSTAVVGYAVTEAQQANWMGYMWNQLARVPYVDVVLLHTMEERKAVDANWLDRFGIIRYPRTKDYKPAYATTKTTLAGLP